MLPLRGVPAKRSFWCFIFVIGSSAALAIADIPLDSTIRDSAFAVLSGGRTGVLYDVPLPTKYSGVAASVIRLRARSFWVSGASYDGIRIPPGALPEPFVTRMAVVYQNLANRSSSHYMVPGYSLTSPVLGLLVYNATNSRSTTGIREIGVKLRGGGQSISVTFPGLNLEASMNSTAVRCVVFRRGGPPEVGGPPSTNNSCSAESLGHFAIAVPSPVADGDGNVAIVVSGKYRGTPWWVWVLALGCGGAFLGSAVMGAVVFLKGRRMVRMERRGEEGETLGSVRVRGVKMPQASMARTKPVLECGSPPS